MFLTILIVILCISLSVNLVAYLITKKTNKRIKKVESENVQLLSQKKSSEIVTGHISEKLAPFTKQFKYDPRKAVFIGMPIDYIVFDDDQVVFIEIKSGNSKLTSKQKKIKNLINNKLVIWETITITGDPDESSNI